MKASALKNLAALVVFSDQCLRLALINRQGRGHAKASKNNRSKIISFLKNWLPDQVAYFMGISR